MWDEKTNMITIDWKNLTSPMTGDQFKAELTLFAGCRGKTGAWDPCGHEQVPSQTRS